MFFTSTHQEVSISVLATRVVLRTPRAGGVNRILRARCVLDLAAGGDDQEVFLQLNVNEQLLQALPASVTVMLQDESAFASWSWQTQFTTSGLAIVAMAETIELGIEVASSVVLLSQSSITAQALVTIIYEEVPMSQTEKLWLARQAPRRFPVS